MSVLPLRYLGDPILRRRADEVEAFDEELRAFAERMVEAMYAHGGVGLAAPQVGRSTRLIVVDVSEARDGSEAFALVNPELLAQEGRASAEEGCLSIPGVTAEVERSARVVVLGFTPAGEPRRLEAGDLLARVLQHEIDHLNGVLFVDRLGPLSRRVALRSWHREAGSTDPESREPVAAAAFPSRNLRADREG